MQGLKRSVLTIETAKGAAMSGQPIILMGYATGLAAILARTDEDTAQAILKKSGSDVSQVLDDLAKRNLIRPSDHPGAHRRHFAGQNRLRRANDFRRFGRPALQPSKAR